MVNAQENDGILELGTKEDGTPYKFLIVDDSEFMIKNLTRMILSFGGEVFAVAHNGQEAVAIYKNIKEEVDIVTLDITMPIMNGIQCLEKLGEINIFVKVVMVTALGQPELVKQAVLRGAQHYIVKPFERKKVFEVFKEVLKT